MVDTESLALARRKASRAVASSTPSISNSTLPGSTLATQYSTLPLPAPMRTSSGFDLARRHAGAAGRLQAVLAERDRAATMGEAGVRSLEHLAILGSLGL